MLDAENFHPGQITLAAPVSNQLSSGKIDLSLFECLELILLYIFVFQVLTAMYPLLWVQATVLLK